MKHLSGIIYALVLCITTVYSLECTNCTNVSGLDCTGNKTKCAANEICASAYYAEIKGGKHVSSWVVRGCGKQDQCSQPRTLSNKDLRLISGVSCSSNDTNQVHIPAENETANHLVCHSCFSESSYCYTKDVVTCTGNENRCARLTFEGNSTTWTTRGCATESFCSKGIFVIKTSKVIENVCTDKSSSIQSNLLLPIVSILLLVKLM
ncbi:phospholipase A2 inhibitor gamma subunit B-like [Pelodytes ibericus]